MDLSLYEYNLPKEQIAKFGAEPRDTSRLLVFDTKTGSIYHDFFYNLDKYLPENSLMVLNETKVVPARLTLYKETEGKVEIFVLVNEMTLPDKANESIPVLSDRKIEVGKTVHTFDKKYHFKIASQIENKFFLQLTKSKLASDEKIDFNLNEFLDTYGQTPLPKYIENDELEENIRNRYQTVFAKQANSVAAPTASLHFTENVFNKLDKKNIGIAKLSLGVGLGTFKNPTPEQIQNKILHSEPVNITEENISKIENAKKENKNIIAVGTTVCRSLESSAFQKDPKHFQTNIFIQPGFNFKKTDILITNFHLPRTSLMMLVQSFLEFKKSKKDIKTIYEIAIAEGYRFYSLGDSMLIL